jgi:hypothetical protein
VFATLGINLFEAAALFGDVIWHLGDETNLTVGLRYTHDAKEFSWRNGPHETPELDALVAMLVAGVQNLYWHVGLIMNASVFHYLYEDRQAIALVTGINNITAGTFGTPFASISEPRQRGVEVSLGF